MGADPANGERVRLARDTLVPLLLTPDSYPDSVGPIELIETHMSWVFLTARHAYKLKKPVRYEFLDFSTLEARRRDCGEEVRLNRRLAPDVYLGVLPLAAGTGGARVGGEGEVMDWLVQMRRLPAEYMLDALLARGQLTDGRLTVLAGRLARFYSHATPALRDDGAYRARLEQAVAANGDELAAPQFGLPLPQVAEVLARQRACLRHRPDLFRRASAGHVVEGHGDLRPEHICLEPEPVIFDCLEFNADFRVLDAADELAFLAMECDRLGAPGVGRAVLDGYAAATGDRPPPALIDFYKSCRAALRAKLSVWHRRDAGDDDWPKWRTRGREYLDMALAYARRL